MLLVSCQTFVISGDIPIHEYHMQLILCKELGALYILDDAMR